MPSDWRPDVIVGVDFGMTCTAVAYSKSQGSDWHDPKAIQRWEGAFGSPYAVKVKTAVGYDETTGGLTTWGFHCDPTDDTLEINENFKLLLDPRYPECIEHPEYHTGARTWFRDYLRSLYGYVIRQFEDQDHRFSSKKVEFVFSVPTTWKHANMLADIERLIRDAGWGQSANHRMEITLTEAEAAAVSACKQQMQAGDVFLVCDAGGGTSDVNVLKVKSIERQRTHMEPLTTNEGQAAGGSLIDFKFLEKLKTRLQQVEPMLPNGIESTAHMMMLDRYEEFKRSIGGGSTRPFLLLPIPDFPPGRDYPSAGIKDSKLVVERTEMEGLFDEQIRKISDVIDKQLNRVRDTHPGESICGLVLSGGLGSSPYVRKALEKRFASGGGGGHTNAEGLGIITAEEPQLAVVKGLVLARVQPLISGIDILDERRCPLSYGVLCRERYDPKKHQGAPVTIDHIDGKRWAEKQIHWLIKEGDLVRTGGGSMKHFRGKVALGDRQKPWRVKIVHSTLPRDQIPRFMAPGSGVSKTCELTLTLSEQDLRLKNYQWWKLGKEHYVADFDIKAVVGTGLKFQVWSRDASGVNTLMSKDHDEIHVEWEDPRDRADERPRGEDAAEIYPK
ncbi:hypothetical protein BAUCODRAFT_157339 [Baudoinia panamericana UAMH 10762]|uniref:Actin-like ATPase domain-containing protein n=1 Tax=Baudoinia panamericana (strain UAMH 10762) TaxID=717646 RepID=M2MWR5_BAUPA|nr:uncharacterized protein BAUCODRAFT_157339 [Baudoinia panamericana UAMH 10762]EMC95983.1 hypothetical protein BAUCODRAFT_157339 [Baudoinia panamericana UAMH 10762]